MNLVSYKVPTVVWFFFKKLSQNLYQQTIVERKYKQRSEICPNKSQRPTLSLLRQIY